MFLVAYRGEYGVERAFLSRSGGAIDARRWLSNRQHAGEDVSTLHGREALETYWRLLQAGVPVEEVDRDPVEEARAEVARRRAFLEGQLELSGILRADRGE